MSFALQELYHLGKRADIPEMGDLADYPTRFLDQTYRNMVINLLFVVSLSASLQKQHMLAPQPKKKDFGYTRARSRVELDHLPMKKIHIMHHGVMMTTYSNRETIDIYWGIQWKAKAANL